MKTKKIVVFSLCAVVPMMCLGLLAHLIENPVATMALSSLAMMLPLLAVVVTQLIYKEPVLRGLGVSFKLNRWWFVGALLMPVLAMAILAVSLLMPGAYWNVESETVRIALDQMPAGMGPWGMIAITLVSGIFAGATINALFAFGEEIGWRGFLVKEFEGKNFMTLSLVSGVIWGFWHFPLILNGHNYPQHPVIGVFMMVLMCVALTPMFLYFRQKSGSVIVPAIMHGTFNAVVGVSNIFVAPANDLLIGGPGLAGIVVMLLFDLLLYLYDRFISMEHIFTSKIR